MARREFLGSVVETTTTGSLTSTDTSIYLTDGSTFPSGSTSPFVIVIDRGTASEEKVLITSRSSNTLTVSQRGYDGTTATTHSSGARVDHVLDATSIQDMNTSINDVTDVITADTANNRVGINKTNPTDALDVVGNITVSGTVDGRDVATDGTKLDGIEAGAVADHGNLAGLADDDHTQYLLADGTRTASGLTVSGDVTVDTDTLYVDATNDRVGISTTTPSAELDVVGETETTTLRVTSQGNLDLYSSTTHGLEVGIQGSYSVRMDDEGIQRRWPGYFGTGSAADLYINKLGGHVKIGTSSTNNLLYLNGEAQGYWATYTPTLYTYSGSSDTHQLWNTGSGSDGYTRFRYAIVDEIVFVEGFVRYVNGYANNSQAYSTLRPRFSVPSTLPVVQNSVYNIANNSAPPRGVALLGGFMNSGYLGTMNAFNYNNEHSSNGFLQFCMNKPASNSSYQTTIYNSNTNNAFAMSSYGILMFSTWYERA